MLKLLFSTILVLFCACSTVKEQATISTYIDPTVRQGQIKSLAIFSLENDSLSRGDIQNLNRRIYERVKRRNPYIALLHPDKTARILRKQNMDSNWQAFYEYYHNYGRPDANALGGLYIALKTETILHIKLRDIVQQNGKFNEKTAVSSAIVVCSIFHTQKNRLIWEGISEGIKENELTFEKAPPLIDAIEVAIDKIMVNFPEL